MCGRFVIEIPYDELKKIFDLIDCQMSQLEPRYNIAPTQQVPVVRNNGDHNSLSLLNWGLIPSWSKDPASGSHLINARSEAVTEKPSFKHAIKYNRCIIPMSGFYEWSHTEGEKHPYFIHLANKAPMGVAGIWEHWDAPDGTALETFSVLTTSANKLVSKLHDRMPVILHPDSYGLWLSKNMHDAHALESLYSPFPDSLMTYHEVPKLVNNPRFDSPACIAKL